MALAVVAPDYPHIVKPPGVRGGKARIDGTRICVVDIVVLHQQGVWPHEMLEYYSSRPLTLAEVHAALGYYYDHQEEIEIYFEASERAAAKLEADRAAYLGREPA
jgi:uncharacterized protein (DUF433 family)